LDVLANDSLNATVKNPDTSAAAAANAAPVRRSASDGKRLHCGRTPTHCRRQVLSPCLRASVWNLFSLCSSLRLCVFARTNSSSALPQVPPRRFRARVRKKLSRASGAKKRTSRKD